MSVSAQAVVSANALTLAEENSLSAPKEPADMYPWLKCTVTVELPIKSFTIRDLLALEIGAVVESACKTTSDLPFRVNGTLIGWTEFEVVVNTLAVRITELA